MGNMDIVCRITEVRGSQKSIPLAYQVSMALLPTSGGGKATFPWDAHLQSSPVRI